MPSLPLIGSLSSWKRKGGNPLDETSRCRGWSDRGHSAVHAELCKSFRKMFKEGDERNSPKNSVAGGAVFTSVTD